LAFWNRIFKKDDSAVAEADKEESSPSDAISPADPEAAALADGVSAKPGKKGIFGKFESRVRRKVDSYVDSKADSLLDDATRRAEQFRLDTLNEVQVHAMALLDLTEQRIDEKLVEVEDMLEKRLRAELKMRLRAMFWTLVFVLVMAGVSFAYVYIKRSAGLDDNKATEQESPGR